MYEIIAKRNSFGITYEYHIDLDHFILAANMTAFKQMVRKIIKPCYDDDLNRMVFDRVDNYCKLTDEKADKKLHEKVCKLKEFLVKEGVTDE